jgi:hypothetical protein
MEGRYKIYLGVIGWNNDDWVHLDEYRDRWRALVKKVRKLFFFFNWLLQSLSDLGLP